jgi:uncharacterized protein YndB with AHSA1/START domain
MEKSKFTYEIYISTTQDELWNALIDSVMTTKYWQHVNESGWQLGSKWEHRRTDKEHTLDLVGKVIEFLPPKRLGLSWAFPADEANEDKHSRVMIEVEPFHDVARLTVTHDYLEPGSDMLEGITAGWPKVLSSLKTLLETGKPLPELW